MYKYCSVVYHSGVRIATNNFNPVNDEPGHFRVNGIEARLRPSLLSGVAFTSLQAIHVV